jgi:hypothetical protein
MLRNIDGRPPGSATREDGSAHQQLLETSTAGPLGGATGESGSVHNQCLEMSMAAPLAAADEDPGAPTINVKKCQCWAPQQVLTKIWERPPSTLTNINVGPLACADEDPGAPTINVKKCQWRAPW